MSSANLTPPLTQQSAEIDEVGPSWTDSRSNGEKYREFRGSISKPRFSGPRSSEKRRHGREILRGGEYENLETRWRRDLDSNFQYQFLVCQTFVVPFLVAGADPDSNLSLPDKRSGMKTWIKALVRPCLVYQATLDQSDRRCAAWWAHALACCGDTLSEPKPGDSIHRGA